MNSTKVSILLFIIGLVANEANGYEVNGFCGRPEKPFQSRLKPDKARYAEGEVVTFQCDQYWNYLQTKQCVRGEWIGDQFRCGKAIADNDLNYVRVEDITEETPNVLFDTNITLTPDYKFANSFLSSRCDTKFEVTTDRRIRWTLGLQRPVSLPFFRINFHLLNVSVDESLQINLTADARVSPYRTCRHVFRDLKRLWRFGTKVELNFECDANSVGDAVEDEKSPTNEIIIETQSSKEIAYKLIMVVLAQGYDIGDDRQAVCGEPEEHYGLDMRIMWPNINYSIQCSGDWEYVSYTNPDLPDTTIHKRQCVYDMRWNGTYPSCVPKTVCPIPEEVDNQINPEFKTVRFNDVFYFNQTKWYAIDGTTVEYQCNSALTQVLLGDAIHVCKNGHWVGTEPNCFDLSELKVRKVKNRASDESSNGLSEN